MSVTKQQLIDGVVKYAKSEIIEKVSDKPLKIIISTAVSMLETNPNIVDGLFKNQFISALLGEKDGFYNLDSFANALGNSMKEYGDFPISIPAMKFISPTEKQLTFSLNDISKLKSYISGGAN